MKKENDGVLSGTVFEGMTSIRAVIAAYDSSFNDRRIIRLLIDGSRRKSKAKEIGWLEYKAGELGFSIEYVTAETIDGMTTGSTHGGIIAECTPRTIPTLSPGLIRENGFYAMLEGVEDPYNFGYAIRSLNACGVDGIILSPRNWMSAAGVVCKSSAGASEYIPLCECDSKEAAEMFKKQGCRVICAGIRDSVSSFDCDLKKPLFLIIGGEKRGISASLLACADEIVRIDYARAFNGSLSASSAAAMLGYEVMRQNRLCD